MNIPENTVVADADLFSWIIARFVCFFHSVHIKQLSIGYITVGISRSSAKAKKNTWSTSKKPSLIPNINWQTSRMIRWRTNIAMWEWTRHAPWSSLPRQVELPQRPGTSRSWTSRNQFHGWKIVIFFLLRSMENHRNISWRCPFMGIWLSTQGMRNLTGCNSIWWVITRKWTIPHVVRWFSH